MSVTSWAGVNILVTATFAKTRTHGMVFVRPLDEEHTLLQTIVWVPRRHRLTDPLAARIRRRFIRAFLHDDSVRADGARQIGVVERDLVAWMEEHEYTSVAQLKGSLSQKNCPDPTAFERAQYMKAISQFPVGR